MGFLVDRDTGIFDRHRRSINRLFVSESINWDDEANIGPGK